MEIVQMVRVVQIIVLILFICVLCVGPGFYIRQEWRGFTKSNNKYDKLIQCGTVPKLGTTWKEAGKSCGLKNHPDIPVATLKGYDGFASLNYWVDLGMYGQFASLILALMLIGSNLALMMTLTPEMDKPPKFVVVCMASGSAIVMLIVMALQWWYINCGNYSANAIKAFDASIQRAKDDPEIGSTLEVLQSDRVVQCKVKGFGISAFFALLSAFIFITDGMLYHKMKPLDKIKKSDADDKGDDTSGTEPE